MDKTLTVYPMAAQLLCRFFAQVLPHCPELADFRFSGTRSGRAGSAAVVEVRTRAKIERRQLCRMQRCTGDAPGYADRLAVCRLPSPAGRCENKKSKTDWLS